MLTVPEAHHLITSHVGPLPVEWTPLLEAQGRMLATGGGQLTPSRIALLTSQGRTHAMVHAPARIAVLSPEPAPAPEPAVVALLALVAEAGGLAMRLPVATADPAVAARALKKALTLDVVLLAGWSFEGMWALIAELGTVHFRAIAQDPGSELGFAVVHHRPIFALSADLPSTLLNFELHIRPALRRMLGHQAQERPRVIAVVANPHAREPGLQAYLPARVEKRAGGYTAHLVSPDGPADAAALAIANGYVVLPPNSSGLVAGDRAETVLLEPQEVCGMACLPIGGDTAVARQPLLGR